MTCKEAKALISPYLDGVAASHQMRALSEHMKDCGPCAREYNLLWITQNAVAGLGRKQPPAELGLRLRVIASQQRATRSAPVLQSLQIRLEHALQAFMVPATAGALSAVVMFGMLIGMFAVPATLRASSDDVPTRLYTPPQLVSSLFSCSFGAAENAAENNDALVVEALVDEAGRVQDYRIISGPENYKNEKRMMAKLENMLIFTVFQPARSFGRPTTGRAILSFSNISVKG